jgi:hypothetical protein
VTKERFDLLGANEKELGTAADGVGSGRDSQRIHWLVENALECVTELHDEWTVLYLDAKDGRYWELSYPQSGLHGGGPPRLCVISRDDVCAKYGVRVTGQTSGESAKGQSRA